MEDCITYQNSASKLPDWNYSRIRAGFVLVGRAGSDLDSDFHNAVGEG